MAPLRFPMGSWLGVGGSTIITNEQVEFEKYMDEVQNFIKITNDFRGI